MELVLILERRLPLSKQYKEDRTQTVQREDFESYEFDLLAMSAGYAKVILCMAERSIGV